MGGFRVALAALLACAVWAAPAIADVGSGPRETVDQSFSTSAPDSPSGLGFTGSYHAANDPNSPPPYMRKMTFYPPAGARFDTSVPDSCTASDVELEAQGPAACPPGSVIGSGTASGIFYTPITHSFVFDRFTHHLDIVNDAGEQIMLIQSEGYTVVRGKFQPDGSIEFSGPTCFPAPPTGCADDYVLQTASTTSITAYVKDGRSYFTTPPTCPASGDWTTEVRFWWADGNIDTVPSNQPCQPPA
jgi:hypothetical protein